MKRLSVAVSAGIVALGYVTAYPLVSPADAATAQCSNLQLAGKDKSNGSSRDWRYAKRCKTPASDKKDQATDTESTAVAGGSGDWLNPSSEAYATAKKAFDLMTQEYGMSGAAAAGVLGGIQPEGNFREDAAEVGGLAGYHVKYTNQAGKPCVPGNGRSGGVLLFGINNKEPVCGMAWYTKKGMLGGGGVFQETPYTKFTDSPFWGKYGPGWDIRNQIAYTIEHQVFTRQLESGCYTWGGKAPSYKGTFKVEDWLGASDPAKAEDIFYTCNLKGYKYFPERMDKARQANAVFNAANVQANPSKWRIGASSTAGGGADLSNANGNQLPTGDDKDKRNCQKCKPGEAKNNQDAASNAPVAGANGKRAWRHYSDLPDDVKKDAIDFERFGMKDLRCDATWNKVAGNAGNAYMQGQCVAFSKVGAYHLWSKGGQPLQPANGNGGVLADNYGSKYGVGTTTKFVKGGIISMLSPAGTPAGHTAIALQEYSDGSVLLAEQNNEMVGAHAGTACGWRYIVYGADKVKSLKFHYFDPAKAGYTLSLDGTGSAAAFSAMIASPSASIAAANNGSIANASAECTDKANGSSSGQFASVIDFAKAQIGHGYVLGTQGPDTFDCSGLAVASYKATGYDLLGTCGRTADSQYHCVKNAGALKPKVTDCATGDLVFFGYGDHASHVGITEDPASEQMVHASSPGVGVIRSSVSYSAANKSLLGCGAPPVSK